MKIISVVGARPNFMKVAPIHKEFVRLKNKLGNSNSLHHLICHTGQHYDEKMSKIFFEDLELPKPDYYLGVGSGSHAEQTAKVMIEFEKVCINENPDLVIVVGDVNSTIACSLTAIKLGIKVAHVEAGLRSNDKNMPEEINRILTDSISTFLFVTERSGLENLRREGISEENIFFVGHVMIDSVMNYLPKTEQSNILTELNLNPDMYCLVTLHRPSNVDNRVQLIKLINLLNSISTKAKIVFPIHPRTKKNIEDFGLTKKINKNILLTDPIGYIDFLTLMKNASLLLTDSGGIQEETTYLGVPCITLRTTTERPVTVDIGTNYLVGENYNEAKRISSDILSGNKIKRNIPELWDGKAAERIVEILLDVC